MTILLFALAGFLVGGAYTFYRSGNRVGGVILSVAAVLAALGAVLWSQS